MAASPEQLRGVVNDAIGGYVGDPHRWKNRRRAMEEGGTDSVSQRLRKASGLKDS